MKVQDLKGPYLDYWVAKAEGVSPYWLKQIRQRTLFPFSYSTEPNRGLAIVEREGIATRRLDTVKYPYHWWAQLSDDNEQTGGYIGETLLEAAMKVYVAMTFGDEVPDE